LPSFGEKLKQEREKRKITLEQISASTKIGTRMLQALEEDKFNHLPGGIFNKGFVRAYARFVGLDEDQTVADYLQASGDAPPPSTEIAPREDVAREAAENVARLEATSDDPSRPLPWGWFAAILLVVALALSLWSHNRREHIKPPARPTPTAAPPVSGTAAGSAPKDPSTPAPSSGDDRGQAGAGSVLAASSSSGSGPSISSSRPAPTSASASGEKAASVVPQPAQGLATLGAAAPGEFTVVVDARQESWVSITTDGTTHSSELLASGSERAMRGRKEIIVKVGNAGGVDLRFNGKKLDTGGDFGEVKTITIGPRGLVPSAPTPASTP
jgi:cytoskeleton protein RodZ